MKASSIEGQDSKLCLFHLNSVHFMTFPKCLLSVVAGTAGSIALCYRSALEYNGLIACLVLARGPLMVWGDRRPMKLGNKNRLQRPEEGLEPLELELRSL